MKKNKAYTEAQFRQFVDETSPEQSAEVEKKWKKKTRQQKNKLFNRILIIATIVIAIIFVITLNFFIKNTNSHTILDEDQDGYTLVKTSIPHLFVLVDNQMQTYETRMIRNVGVVYGELISWIEANIVSNNKILYIPNQNSGTTLLGMALGYYLSTSNGGSLDILVKTDAYKQHLNKNTQYMKNFKNQKIIFSYLDSQDTIGNNYHLLIVENNDFLTSLQLTKFKKIIEIIKSKWDDSIIGNYMKNYLKYEISKGRFNSQALQLGQFKGYSLIQLSEGIREQYKSILILNKKQQNLNLCPENVQFFKTSSEKRNLLEYFRNKTLGPKELLFYCLNDNYTQKSLAQLENIRDFFISANNSIEAIKNQEYPYSRSIKHTYILSWSDFNQFKTKLRGEIFLYITSQKQASQIETVLNINSVKMISPFNNNGCLYPAPLFTYKTIMPFHPFFLVLANN